MPAGKGYAPPKGAQQPGKGLSNSQTRNSPSTVNQGGGSSERGARMDPPKGAQQPGRGFAKSQTRNSLTPRR
ncbi:MAG: hypothetical protein OEW90_01770 [Betaproteobacteria bacterium]|nr:hypothetical protein [Betaproteobacteria bacterium]MDH4322847.1 hypothetical protein [Betaproteobacteria bacterium]MDH5210109.1 hypothetical protein [Betaproteobacteria bacterium]